MNPQTAKLLGGDKFLQFGVRLGLTSFLVLAQLVLHLRLGIITFGLFQTILKFGTFRIRPLFLQQLLDLLDLLIGELQFGP